MLARVKAWLLGPDNGDGFGLSFIDELRFAARVRRLRRTSVVWRPPGDEEAGRYDAHPIAGRFGDMTIAVARVAGRDWIVRDRMWHGWPDPPEYVAFAFDDDSVWAAADFDHWPRMWTGIVR